ncbi:YIP1 family protein [Haloglomus litoreum]|uniref:YIP1 family protein n=1 Tax=Haloglomus litoreum TaxID=3034026 RepID=UPI0023E8BB50|nr:YIP1 family protein [Haloglomus sp. DT116]
MTTWVENPEGGRARGPVGLARAWVEVLIRPRRFFENGVAPGDQAPGLVFAIAVTLVHVALRGALVPDTFPVYLGRPVLSAAFTFLVAGLFVAPVLLHLTAAVQTVLLRPFVRDRAGVSETVQVVAYASAPGVFAALPVPGLRLVAALYGAVLLVVGLAVVHETSIARAAAAGALPALIVFGYAFGGVAAFETLAGVDLTPDPRAGTGNTPG